MKILTIAVPAYNCENTINICLDSLLGVHADVEVILVNNGSEDGTGAILESYVDRYPQDFQILDKEHGEIGSAINLAMQAATTPWFKIIDPDDRFEPAGLQELVEVLRGLQAESPEPEMVVSDFLYAIERPGAPQAELIVGDYANVFPGRGITSWSRMKNFRVDQLLGKQSLTYSKKLLSKINLHLPENLAYAEELFAYEPLPHVRRIYYLDTPVYIYCLGRPGQNSHLPVMVDHMKDLMLLVLEMFRRVRITSVKPQRLKSYMYRHIARMIATCMMLMRANSPGKNDTLKQMDLFWQELIKVDPEAARKLQQKPMLNPKRLLKAAGTYVQPQVYNLVGKVFML